MRKLILAFLPRGSVVLGLTTLGSYVLGLVRDRLFAHTFGASAALDSYNAAFLVPDFLFNLLVASGIAAAAVPLFTQLKTRSRAEAYGYINALMSAAMVAMVVVSLVVLIAAPWLSYTVAPGLDQHSHEQGAALMRILALSPILFAASNALGAFLVAEKRFLFYGLSPLLYNIGIIGGTMFLAPVWGIEGVAWGTVIGALLHMLVRFVDARRSGWQLRPTMYWRTPEMKQTVKLMLPKMVGHPVELVTFWIFTSLASLLAPGSIVVLNFARNFQSVPVSFIGIVMATVVFASLSEAALVSTSALRQVLWRTAGVIFAASTLAAVLVFFLRHVLIARLLGGGAFDVVAIETTAWVLGVFCLAIPTESLSHLLARAFYATKNTVTPVVWSVINLIVAAGSAWWLLGSLGIVALPVGFFLGSLVKTVGLGIRLSRQQ
jgi:putative peptidoglycan lipid II flippase